MSFEEWQEQINTELENLINLRTDDLPDFKYQDLFDAGETPKSVASKMILFELIRLENLTKSLQTRAPGNKMKFEPTEGEIQEVIMKVKAELPPDFQSLPIDKAEEVMNDTLYNIGDSLTIPESWKRIIGERLLGI